jgi:hypothetical protein
MATTLHALSLAIRITGGTAFLYSPTSWAASRKENIHDCYSPPPCGH